MGSFSRNTGWNHWITEAGVDQDREQSLEPSQLGLELWREQEHSQKNCSGNIGFTIPEDDLSQSTKHNFNSDLAPLFQTLLLPSSWEWAPVPRENITSGVSESAGTRPSVNFIGTVNPAALSSYLWSPEHSNCWIYCLWLLHYLFKMQSKPLCLLHYLRQTLLLSSLARAVTLVCQVCVSNNSPQDFSSHLLDFFFWKCHGSLIAAILVLTKSLIWSKMLWKEWLRF